MGMRRPYVRARNRSTAATTCASLPPPRRGRRCSRARSPRPPGVMGGARIERPDAKTARTCPSSPPPARSTCRSESSRTKYSASWRHQCHRQPAFAVAGSSPRNRTAASPQPDTGGRRTITQDPGDRGAEAVPIAERRPSSRGPARTAPRRRGGLSRRPSPRRPARWWAPGEREEAEGHDREAELQEHVPDAGHEDVESEIAEAENPHEPRIRYVSPTATAPPAGSCSRPTSWSA